MIKKLTILLFLNCFMLVFGQNTTTTPFKTFIQKEKFSATKEQLSVPDLNPIVEKNLNSLATVFEFISTSSNPEEKYYLLAIKKTTDQLKPYELDLSIQDKTRIANYIEELMDLVQLESSNGILNQFVYGFDPTKK